MVNSFNDLIAASREGGGNTRLQRELGSIARTFSSALSRVGISMNSNGWMDIDEDRMRQAAERGDLDRFAQRGGSGANFLNRMERLSDNISRSPQNFAPANEQNMGFGGGRQSNRWLGQMNRLASVGMLFDSFM